MFWNKNILRYLFFSLIIFVAHFFNFRSFGLYEDDYAFISLPLGWNLSNLSDYTKIVFINWPQGRPLGFFIPRFFAFIGAQLGGLYIIYLFAFLIISINAFLFYTLLKKVGSETIAFTGALAFSLFPADTTHSFLTHAFQLQISLTFLLFASICYVSGRQISSYPLILGSLLSYESPFMVFMAIPLLNNKWDRKFMKELIRHAGILLGIILIVILIRTITGDDRVVGIGGNVLSIFGILDKIGKSIFIGPLVSLYLFLYGLIRIVFHWNSQLTFVFIACLLVFSWVLYRLRTDSIQEKCEHLITFRSRILNFNGTLYTPTYYSRVVKLSLAAIVSLCLAYTLSFTHYPPTAKFGRMTSVHLAAAFGGSLLFACICSVFLSIASGYQKRRFAIIVLAIYLSLLVTYRFSIQFDFMQAWQNQKAFWTSAIKILPDITDETVIFVLNHDLPKTRYIETNSWADPIILDQIFQFPDYWKLPPRLFVVSTDWTSKTVIEGDQIKWEVPTATWWSHWEVLPNSNLIVLEMENGDLVRRFGTIQIYEQNLDLKPLPQTSSPNLQYGPLYNYLIIR